MTVTSFLKIWRSIFENFLNILRKTLYKMITMYYNNVDGTKVHATITK